MKKSINISSMIMHGAVQLPIFTIVAFVQSLITKESFSFQFETESIIAICVINLLYSQIHRRIFGELHK